MALIVWGLFPTCEELLAEGLTAKPRDLLQELVSAGPESAIVRGAARFRFAKFGGKVVSNAAESRRRRDQHELRSE